MPLSGTRIRVSSQQGTYILMHEVCSVKRLQGRRRYGLLDFFYIAVEKLIFFAAFCICTAKLTSDTVDKTRVHEHAQTCANACLSAMGDLFASLARITVRE